MPTEGQKALSARANNPKMSVRQTELVELAEKRKSKKGMGFEAAATQAAKSAGVSKERGRAIVAAASQKASAAAKKSNPNLKKVPTKGSHKTKGGTYK